MAVLAAACDRANRSGDADRCARALLQIQDRLEQAPTNYDYLPDYVAGCGWVYRQASCRQAWEDAAQHAGGTGDGGPLGGLRNDDRSDSIAAACGRAYCGQLDDPKPPYCSGSKNLEQHEIRFTAWPLLHTAILRRELKGEPALLAALRAWFAPIYVSSALPVDVPKPAASGVHVQVVLAVELAANGDITVDGTQLKDVSGLLSLAQQARAKNPDIRAVIRADKAVRHGTVIQVLDLLKQAGIAKIAFGVRRVDSEQ